MPDKIMAILAEVTGGKSYKAISMVLIMRIGLLSIMEKILLYGRKQQKLISQTESMFL